MSSVGEVFRCVAPGGGLVVEGAVFEAAVENAHPGSGRRVERREGPQVDGAARRSLRGLRANTTRSVPAARVMGDVPA
jgi:hypothetical protein